MPRGGEPVPDGWTDVPTICGGMEGKRSGECNSSNAKDNAHRHREMNAFLLPGQTPVAFGDKQLSSITADDIEVFRAARKAEGLSVGNRESRPQAVAKDVQLGGSQGDI